MERTINLQISHNKKIFELQKEFNEVFPFLKLEFFKHRHAVFKGSARKDMVDNDFTIGHLNRKQASGVIILKPAMKVSELEDILRNNFGLSAQVFRKSGKTWIETTVTDDWTLEQQNEEGRELTSLRGSSE
jgi:hypothetical protein